MASKRAVRALGVLGAVASLGALVACSGAEDELPNLGGAAANAGGGPAAESGGSAGSLSTGGTSGVESTGGGRPALGGAPSGGSAGVPNATGGTSAAGRGGGAGMSAAGAGPAAGGSSSGAPTSGSGGMTPGLEACPEPPEGTPDAAVIAINTENAVRLAMGIECAAIALPLCTAAQNHCDYYTENQGTECEAPSPHDEIEGCPGYTGEGLGERFETAGYMLRGGGSECMAFANDPVRSVMMFIDSVYHRTPMLDPWMRDFGYGASDGCDTIDFGTGASTPQTVTAVYPHADQTGVPTSFDGSREGPEPPEPSSGWPSGYPIMVYARDFTVTSHSITLDGASEELAHQWLDEDDQALPSYAKVLYTDAPMLADTTYHVIVSGELDGAAKTFDWKFTTGAATGGGRPRN